MDSRHEEAEVTRFLHIVAGAILGGPLGFWLLLPPNEPEYDCGLMVVPAFFLGLPAGLVLGGLLGSAISRAKRGGAGDSSHDWRDRLIDWLDGNHV
jgi:hypothetical protein